MTFLELRQRVAELSGLDQEDPTTDTRIKAWINEAYKDISAFFDWPWLLKQAIIQTQPDVTTGTVSVTNSMTAVTLSSAPSTSLGSLAGQWALKISGSDDFYFIDSHTSGSTSLTLSNPYLGTTGSKTYELKKLYYSLSSDMDRLQDIRSTVDDHQLIELDPMTLDSLIPSPTSSGTNVPNYYYFFGYDSSKNWQIGFEESPSSQVNLLLRYFQKITDLSVDTDTPLVPVKFHNSIIYGAISLYGYVFIDDTRVQLADAKFKEILTQMTRSARPGKSKIPVIQPWDQRSRVLPGRPRLPANSAYIR